MVLSPKLDFDFVFSRIDYASVYARELPGVGLKQAICSPLRQDRSPSFVLTIGQSGQMRHVDMAYPDDNRFSGGAVDFVMSRYGLNSFEALRKIAEDFCLLEKSGNRFEEIKRSIIKPVMDIKRVCLIQIEARKWTKQDLEYWSRYGISIEELRREEVYPIKHCWINRVECPLQKQEIAFAYRFPNGFKLYFPLREKESGERWKSNIPTSTVEGANKIDSHNRIIVTKSRKDSIVLSRYLPGVISVQNETRAAFNGEFLSKLQGKEVIINFDSDLPGKTNSMKLTKEHNFRHLNVPDKYFPKAKDFSDLFFHFGEKAVLDHLKLKNLI